MDPSVNADAIRGYWAERTGEYAPEYYAHHGPNATSETIGDILDAEIDRDARVLELGCSVGRHLSHLFDRGFDQLAGIDVNDDAFDAMAATYPDLATAIDFYPTAIEEAVDSIDDDSFGAVYSVEVLQHLHPEANWVYEELSRITDGVLITAENEGDTDHASSDVTYINDEFPLYHRDWGAIFTQQGFTGVNTMTRDRYTIRTFRNT